MGLTDKASPHTSLAMYWMSRPDVLAPPLVRARLLGTAPVSASCSMCLLASGVRSEKRPIALHHDASAKLRSDVFRVTLGWGGKARGVPEFVEALLDERVGIEGRQVVEGAGHEGADRGTEVRAVLEGLPHLLVDDTVHDACRTTPEGHGCKGCALCLCSHCRQVAEEMDWC